MKIISLVPSWSETLIELGFQVCGRTRYCLYPDKMIGNIQVVGGTKDVDWGRLNSLGADLLVVDKEENRQEVEERSQVPILATHVRSLKDVPVELEKIKQYGMSRGVAEQVLQELQSVIKRWKVVASHPLKLDPLKIQGLQKWINEPDFKPRRFIYVIWEKPWMSVSRETFIGDMLNHIYQDIEIPTFKTSYPQLELTNFNDGRTLFLFSSEPFPFGLAQNILRLKNLGLPSALVDGESYSWFGLRSLKFLESLRSV